MYLLLVSIFNNYVESLYQEAKISLEMVSINMKIGWAVLLTALMQMIDNNQIQGISGFDNKTKE